MWEKGNGERDGFALTSTKSSQEPPIKLDFKVAREQRRGFYYFSPIFYDFERREVGESVISALTRLG